MFISVWSDNEEAKKEEDTAALIQEETRRYIQFTMKRNSKGFEIVGEM